MFECLSHGISECDICIIDFCGEVEGDRQGRNDPDKLLEVPKYFYIIFEFEFFDIIEKENHDIYRDVDYTHDDHDGEEIFAKELPGNTKNMGESDSFCREFQIWEFHMFELSDTLI